MLLSVMTCIFNLYSVLLVYYNVNFIIKYMITCLIPNSVKLSFNHNFNPKRKGRVQ